MNRLAGHEAAQADLRKLVQSGFGRLDQRIDATKQATEAATQHTQNQATRQAQEELRKLAQSEFGRLGQRMDMLKQDAEAAAQRAQNQAVRAAQEELRKLAQSEFGRLGQRMDMLKQDAEAAAQRAQNQAVRAAQEELRKLAQSELGRVGQRMDVLKQDAEAAAQRAKNQAIQEAQKDLRDLEGRMQNLVTKSQTSAPAPEGGEIGRLRDEMEDLGQRVDDLTIKAASEHDLDSLRIAIEQLSARVAQRPDLKTLADLDRRLTEITNKLEQSCGNHVGNQIDAADLDKRIAAAMRQNQISPPWSVIERKFAGFSDRLANTEMHFEHVATLEKWIIQLYRNLEETLDWTRDVAEDAASRMESRLVEEWSSETNPAATSAEFEALENALAAVRTDHKDADQRNQKALGAVKDALEQIVSKLTEFEQIVSKLTELEQLRDQVLVKAAPGDSGTEPLNPEANQPEEMPGATLREVEVPIQGSFLAGVVRANQMPMHSLAEPAGHRRSDGDRHEASSRLSLRLRRREGFAPPASAPAYAPAVRGAAHPGMRHWLIGLVVLAAVSVLVTQSGIERTKPLAALTQFAAILGGDMLASLLPEASNAATGGGVIADTDGRPSGIGTANCQQAVLHRDAKAAFILRSASPTTCRAVSQMVYPR